MRLDMELIELSFMRSAVECALEKLYEQDRYLIVNQPRGNRMDYHVSERGIVFRFGVYFQQLLSKTLFCNYNVDVEYNRNLYEKKLLPTFANGTFPDLIVHKRGSNDDNVLILEFKTWWNYDTTSDEKKIKEFMDPTGRYRYCMGACIVLEKDEPKVIWMNCEP